MNEEQQDAPDNGESPVPLAPSAPLAAPVEGTVDAASPQVVADGTPDTLTTASPANGHGHGRRHVKPTIAPIRFEDVVTGQFDADEEDVALELPKRVLSAQPETPKLHKV